MASEGRVSVNAKRIRDLVRRADNDPEQEGALAEYLVDSALDIADVLERIPELEQWRTRAESAASLYETAVEERDAMRQRAERLEMDLGVASREALAAPKLIMDQVRRAEIAEARAERLEAALRPIASCEPNAPGDVVHMARAALADAPVPAREGDELNCWVSECCERSGGDVHVVLRRAAMPDMRVAFAACAEHISQFERVQQDPGYVQHWEIQHIWRVRAGAAAEEGR